MSEASERDDQQEASMTFGLTEQFVDLSRAYVLSIASAAVVLGGCAGYFPGKYADWDATVKKMCEQDGGVTVYERVKLTEAEYLRLGGVGGTIPVPRKATAKAGSPYVAENTVTWLHDSNPSVFRSETLIVRASDGKVLSRLINYARVGRDFVQPYGCSDVGVRLDVERQTFKIVGR